MKKLTFMLLGILLICSLSVSAALTKEDFVDVTFDNNLGNVKNSDHVTINIQKGWNMLPLDFIGEASGRYWGNYQEGKTCDQDIFQTVWMYSPVKRDYYHIPVIDDWLSPKTRDNSFLQREFGNKYYHIYGGSAWVYSPEQCILEGDHGVQIIFQTYGDELQGKGYEAEDLVLKAGWNFIPVNLYMVAYEKPLRELFEGCGVQKYNVWDNHNQKWMLTSAEMNQLVEFDQEFYTDDLFKTLVIKTSRDCNFGENIINPSSGSTPPSIPN